MFSFSTFVIEFIHCWKKNNNLFQAYFISYSCRDERLAEKIIL